MRLLTTAVALTLPFVVSAFAEGTLALKDLPHAMQKTVLEHLKGGEIKAISKEREGGITQYEVEFMFERKAPRFQCGYQGGISS